MADAILRIKTVMDVGDAVSNVGTIQKALSKLKLPDNLKDNLNKNIGSFYKEYEKYQKKLGDGLKTQGDFNQVEKSLNRMKALYSEIGKDAAKAIKIDPEALFNLDEGKFKNIANKIEQTLQKLSNLKIDKKPFEDARKEIEGLSKNQKIVGDEGILARMMGHIETGEIGKAKQEYTNLINEVKKAAPVFDEMGNRISKPGTFNVAHYQQLQSIISKLGVSFSKASTDVRPLEEELNRLQQEMAETVAAASKDLVGNVSDYNKQVASVEKVTDSLKRMHEEEYSFNRQAQDIDRQIQSYFGLSQMIRKVADIARDAFNTVKELDAAMVETAVVTNFSVGDMWDMLPTYTANANQLGSTIKDVYEAATLYYQQGLNQAQSMGLANETLKMARIGGLQAADATNMMTAALRGFNMEINQVSAKRINDVYSELAAITAADTKEIGSAMERTASIANSANMQFETTSAFLAQMIETTREAPENLGTAMKTIIARFQEMKQDPTKLVDSEGVALDANKIDTALKTIGVDLKNQKGEFRDLDTVFLEISEKWDSLTQGQQRYIATIAAGSRQQSRFIAMMQNYERVKELVDAANNSAGASQKQFEKTLDSMSSKLNRLKNAWDQFTMGLMNNQILKGGVDALTGFFTVVNKIFDVLTKPFPDPFGGLIKSALTLTSTLALLNLGKKGARGAVMAGVGWWKGEGNIAQNFASGWGSANAAKAGTTDGKIYAENFNKAIKSGQIKEAFNLTKQQAQKTKPDNKQYQNTFKAAYGQFSAAEVAKDWTPEIQAELERTFDRATKGVDLSKYGIKDADEYKKGFISRLKGGMTSPAEEALRLEKTTGGEVKLNEAGVNEIEQTTNKFEKLSSSIQNTGSNLQYFGMALQNTPLAPIGSIITAMGSALMGLGGIVSKVAAVWTAGITTATGATLTGTAAMRAGFSALFAEIWAFFTTNPVGWLILAIAGVVAAVKGIDAIYESNAEKLEKASDGAAKASEAFDSAKQETSELNDAISRIRENESAFDNLVAGTADFNEQMVTANEQITELLQKYPMLNDYVSTDKNGLMHISEEGLEAVKDYQKQIQARASATNIIQSADLAALENQQKAEKLRKKSFRLTEEEIKKNKEDAQLLEDRAKAEVEMARRNAARTILNGKEIKDVEAMSAIYASLYEEKRKVAEAEVNGMSKKDIAQQYADYHGYTYTKSTNKMKDTEGNEVDFDDKVIKDEVIENTVLLDFEANAESLDNILTNLNNKFSETLGDAYKDSDNFVSDLLSSNIETNTDLLKDVLSDSSTQLSDLVHSMSDEELAAILGVTQSEVSNNLDTYQNQAINLLTERANSIVEAQSQSYAKLGEMMARASDVGLVAASTNTIQSSISKQIAELSTQQANTLSTIGQTLEQNVGPEAMETFIREASSIYLQKNEQLSKEFDGILNNINWESPTSRLEGYHNAINSTNEDIQNWGKSMRASAGEANILGDAFTEFLSKDWEELSQNADNFKNSMGEIDNAGIMAAAKESKTLNSLLESGEVSATGLAKALQAVEDGSLSEVNSTVLELLSSMNRLGDAALEAHEIVSNFDPGIDFGEGEDFVKENAEKAKEYYDNGEWGNQQLQNYIKLAAGTDRWNEALRKNDGNLQKTTDDLMKYVTTFSDGFQPAWDQMISKKNINGKNLSDAIKDAVDNVDTTGVSKELGKKFEDVEVSWDNEGFMQIDVGDLTTQELETYFQEIYGVSKEYARLLMQDLANYDGEVSAALAKNDLQATVGDKEFRTRHLDREGNFTLSSASLQAFEQAGGDVKELAEAAGTTAEKLKENALKVTDAEGNRLKVNAKMLQEFDKRFGTGKGRIDSLITDASLQGAGGKLDLSKLIEATKVKGEYDEQQSLDAAYKAYQRASQLNQSTLYDGVELEKGLDRKGWEEAISNAQDTSKWVPIGEAIAQGFMNVVSGENYGQKPEQPTISNDTTTTTTTNSETTEKSSKIRPTHNPQETITLHGDTTDVDNKINTVRTHYGEVQEEINQKPIKPPADTGETDKKVQSVGSHWGEVQGKVNQKPIKPKADTEKADKNVEAVGSHWGEVVQSGANNPLVVKADTTKADKDVEAVGAHWGEIVKSGANNPLVLNTQPSATNKKGGQSQTTEGQGEATQTSKNLEVTYVTTITNEGEIKAYLDSRISRIIKDAQSEKKLKLNASITVDYKKGKQAKADKSKATVDYKKGKQENAEDKSAKVNYTLGKQAAPKDKSATVNYTLGSMPSIDTSKTITLSPKFVGTWEKTVKLKPSEAKGRNNHISHQSSPSFGSAAKGRYGRVGPKDRGGLTLTGEKGFEIAWLPSENRSMVLGAKGPQMINLPRDAVVYTHEQSEKIIKQKSIPAGSHAKTGRQRHSSNGNNNNNNNNNNNRHHNNNNSNNSSNGTSGRKKIIKNAKALLKKYSKVAQVAGKVNYWWWNMGKKVEQTQRKIDKLFKDIEKQLKNPLTKLNSLTKQGGQYIGKLKQQISLNTKMEKVANKNLSVLDRGNSTVQKRVKNRQAQVNKDKTTLKNAKKELKKAKGEKAKKKAQKKVKSAEKKLKKDQKRLDKARTGVNYATISYDVKVNKAQEKYEKALKKYQKAKTKKDRKKAKKELDKAGKELKKKKTTKKTKKTKVNLSPYIKYDSATGEYQIDYDKINKKFGKNKSKAKAVGEAAQKKLDDYISKRNAAEDKIDAAKEKIEEYGQKIYETFYGWENELTKILNITKQIEAAEAQANKMKSASEASKAFLNASTEEAFLKFGDGLKYFKAEMTATATAIKKRGQAIEEQRTVVQKAIGTADENAELNVVNQRVATENETISSIQKKINSLNTERKKKKTSKKRKEAIDKEIAALQTKLNQAKEDKVVDTAYQTSLKQDIGVKETARKYITTETLPDGSITVLLNSEALERDRLDPNKTISNELYEGIKKYYDDLLEQNEELNKLYEEQIDALAGLAETLQDLREQYADRSEELVEAIEDEAEAEIDKFEKLSSAITDSLKDLLDEVKNKLEERRRQEDNKKTRNDISKKQQRLAALRANTAGGNQVEIAQLEKEIADAQQDYQRTLEDQLLDRLQSQADEAAKQRERQIELMRMQLDVDKANGKNIALVNLYLSDVETYSKEIEKLWKAKNKFDDQTDARKKVLEGQLAAFMEDISTNGLVAKIAETEATIKKVEEDKQQTEQAINETANTISEGGGTATYEKTYEGAKKAKANNVSAAALKESGFSADLLIGEDKNNPVYSYTDLRLANYTPEEIKNTAGIDAAKQAYLQRRTDAEANKQMGVDEFLSVKNYANVAGLSAGSYLKDLAATEGLTWEIVLKTLVSAASKGKFGSYQNNMTGLAKKLVKTYAIAKPLSAKNLEIFSKAFNKAFSGYKFPNSGKQVTYDYTLSLVKKKDDKTTPFAFASGGLANYTGPAWLDGTPSKPELVLNPTDTKNFLALRDVLGKAIKTSNTTNNAYGNNTYEININVDHINNDYDVDRIAERVKKDIVKSASYRNVTQVRNFR